MVRARAGLANRQQPTASFLFCGSTGVGKTEMAKTLARELFDDEKQIVRIDLSEFSEQHSVSRLTGPPPGYVGWDEGGALTEAVRHKPYSVILLDEIEKAHRTVLNVLLQVLDDGILTDGKGQTVDFTNTVIIATSNLGAAEAQGLEGAAADRAVRDAVRAYFAPEFVNRLDEIVVFHRLERTHMGAVVELLVSDLRQRLLEKEIELVLKDSAVDAIVREAYDPVYGARPLKRYIESHITSQVSKLIIRGDLPPGSTVSVQGKRRGGPHRIAPDGDEDDDDSAIECIPLRKKPRLPQNNEEVLVAGPSH